MCWHKRLLYLQYDCFGKKEVIREDKTKIYQKVSKQKRMPLPTIAAEVWNSSSILLLSQLRSSTTVVFNKTIHNHGKFHLLSLLSYLYLSVSEYQNAAEGECCYGGKERAEGLRAWRKERKSRRWSRKIKRPEGHVVVSKENFLSQAGTGRCIQGSHDSTCRGWEIPDSLQGASPD